MVRVGAPSKIFNPIWLGIMASILSSVLIRVGLIVALCYYIFSKPLRLLEIYIFLR